MILLFSFQMSGYYLFLHLDTFKPFAKNPFIADVFREIGLADELGSGMRNTYKYTKLYSGGVPDFEEGDMFTTTVPLTDAATGVKVGRLHLFQVVKSVVKLVVKATLFLAQPSHL